MRAAQGPTRRAFCKEAVIRVAALLVIAALVAGCAKFKPDAPSKSEEPLGPSVEVITKKPRMEAQTTDGKKLWTISAAQAKGKLGSGGDSAELEDVDAVLYEEGKPSMKLKAAAGRANEFSGRLVLWGGVRADSTDGQTQLTCDKISWQRDDRVLVATGKVVATSSGMTVGPAQEARALFRAKDDKMSTSTTTALVLVSLTLVGGHQTISYRDKAGNMNVSGFQHFKINWSESGDIATMKGDGFPFTAKWLKQGLTVYGEKLDATIAVAKLSDGTQSYRLVKGKFTGSTHAVVSGAKGNMDLSGLSLWTAEQLPGGKLWKFEGDGSPFTAKFPDNGITISGHHFEASASMTANSGLESVEFQTATFTGGVKATVSQKERKGGKTFTITAACPTVTINREAHTMVMSGGVHIEGDHPSLGPGGAVGDAPRIVIEFDDAMKSIKSVSMDLGT